MFVCVYVYDGSVGHQDHVFIMCDLTPVYVTCTRDVLDCTMRMRVDSACKPKTAKVRKRIEGKRWGGRGACLTSIIFT